MQGILRICSTSQSNSPPAGCWSQAKSLHFSGTIWCTIMRIVQNYIKSGKKLPTEMIESQMDYFQALFAQKKVDCTLKHAEMNWLCNCTKQHIANDVCKKRNACKMSYMRHELQEHTWRDDWSYCQQYNNDIDDDCNDHDRGHSGCRFGCEEHDNQKRATAWQWASTERAAKEIIIKQRHQKIYGLDVTSFGMMKKVFATMASVTGSVTYMN